MQLIQLFKGLTWLIFMFLESFFKLVILLLQSGKFFVFVVDLVLVFLQELVQLLFLFIQLLNQMTLLLSIIVSFWKPEASYSRMLTLLLLLRIICVSFKFKVLIVLIKLLILLVHCYLLSKVLILFIQLLISLNKFVDCVNFFLQVSHLVNELSLNKGK